jgi:chorismate-pyruvate lyase
VVRETVPYVQLLTAEYATEVLDRLVGEPIRVEVRRQRTLLLRGPSSDPLAPVGPLEPVGPDGAREDAEIPPALLAAPGDRMIVRDSRLVGRPLQDGERRDSILAVAAAWIIADRLPTGAVDDLLRAALPVGRVLRRWEVDAPPEILYSAIVPAGRFAHEMGVGPAYPLLHRVTCRRRERQPVMVVREVFCDSSLLPEVASESAVAR